MICWIATKFVGNMVTRRSKGEKGFWKSVSYNVYRTKSDGLPGRRYCEVYLHAFGVYRREKKRTKRRPYLRSKYFCRDKIFLDFFWNHIHEKKNIRDKTRRLRYFLCGLELLRYSTCNPVTVSSTTQSSELLHRFFGQTASGELFVVQIREDKRNGQKSLMSIFPWEK